jgi:hypothetical protein
MVIIPNLLQPLPSNIVETEPNEPDLFSLGKKFGLRSYVIGEKQLHIKYFLSRSLITKMSFDFDC